LVVITLIIESNSGPATQEDAAEWADSYGLTFPVLADPNNTGFNYISTDPSIGGSYGLPNSQLLSPGMRVEIVNGGVYENNFTPFLSE
jgi:hypothetical protein